GRKLSLPASSLIFEARLAARQNMKSIMCAVRTWDSTCRARLDCGAEPPPFWTARRLPSQALRSIIRSPLTVWLTVALSGLAHGQTKSAELPVISGALSLHDALRTGLGQNLSIKAAQAEARAAVGERDAVKSRLLPQLSATTYLATGDATNILTTA